MQAKKQEIREIRKLGMMLHRLTCLKQLRQSEMEFARVGLPRLEALIKKYRSSYESGKLNDFYLDEICFGIEIVQDKAVRQLAKPPRSVRAISVPFETNRKRH